jgi:hypothetical protein
MKEMKRTIYILLLGGLSLLMAASCKKQSLLTYNASNNIYFNYISDTAPTRYSDTVNITFAFSGSSVTDTVFNLPVAVTGSASNKDRVFEMTVDPASTAVASTDYVLPGSFLVHAGRLIDTISILFKRTAAIKISPVSLVLQLKENDQFRTQFPYRGTLGNSLSFIDPTDTIQVETFKVNLSDMLQAGPYWSGYSYYFGDFSEKKVRLMNQITGMPLDFWSVDSYSSTQQQASTLYYGGFMARYLSDQAYQGNILFEADGITKMTMGSYFQ